MGRFIQNPDVKFSYPRLALEEYIWLKFKSHCVENKINVEQAMRKLIVRYLKVNNLLPQDTPEDFPEGLLSTKIKSDPNSIRSKKRYQEQRAQP